jgi:hypothetical protein
MLGCLAYLFPRIVIALVWLFSQYFSVYKTVIWPVLGFVFMPLTTLAYAYAINAHGSLDGVYLVVFVVAVLMDLGTHGTGPLRRRRRRED